MKQKHILMSQPTFFKIDYEINPWMKLDNQVDIKLAHKQWQNLYDIYTKTLNYKVDLIKPQDNLPDMVFTANGGLVINNKVAVANFRHIDRQPETSFFKDWFFKNGFLEILESSYNFEGEGDALIWNDYIFMGYPWRSDYSAHKNIGRFFHKKVISLQLIDAKFYHLDTCFSPIDNQTIALYPKAFSDDSLSVIQQIVPKVIYAQKDDAYTYGLNACSDGKNVVIPSGAVGLIDTYKSLGLKVYPIDMSEFLKSGGGVKCLTLEFH